MADYYERARSNYFKVRDEQAFRAVFENLEGVKIHAKDDKFCLIAENGWPQTIPGKRDDWDDDIDFDIVNELKKHLAHEEVCVLLYNGNTKMQYLSGGAYAFTNKEYGDIDIEIDHIYKLAKEKFGIEPTRAEY